jgi:hypothetical protein
VSTIDTTLKTSRVFDGTLAVYDRLVELAAANGFPPHDVLGTRPKVLISGERFEDLSEYVVVALMDDPSSSDWVLLGPASKEERFVVDVGIWSAVPSEYSPRNAVLRLEALADVVQSITWDAATNKPKAVGFRNERRVGSWQYARFRLDPSDNGMLGQAHVRFGLTAQL